MYPYVLWLHIVCVMLFFGAGIATDAALVFAGRNPDSARAVLRLVKGRNLLLEAIGGGLGLVLGLTLLMVNPAGMGIFQTGGWIHAKVGAGLLAILMVLGSRVGIREDGVARWVVPVRGVGLLLVIITVFAAEVMRQTG